MKADNIQKEIKSTLANVLPENVRLSNTGNPGRRYGYWLAGGAVVAAGAAWAFGYYRAKRKQRNALNPNPVAHVDLNRYLGRWYEIARIPYKFEKGATDVQAFYSLKENGDIRVENYCIRNGKVEVARGNAHVVDKTSNAKLKVSFFWPFQGDYWILGLCPNYQWALVGGPSGDYLWILARVPKIDPPILEEILQLARDKGYDTTRLSYTPQETSHIMRVEEKEAEDGHRTQPNGLPAEAEPKVLYPDIE